MICKFVKGKARRALIFITPGDSRGVHNHPQFNNPEWIKPTSGFLFRLRIFTPGGNRGL